MIATTTYTTIHATETTTIEVDQDGRYYLTSNAVTRELVTPWLYTGWGDDAIKSMRDGFASEGMADEHIDGYIRQALGE